MACLLFSEISLKAAQHWLGRDGGGFPPPFLYNLYFGKGPQSLEAHGGRLLAPGAPLTYFNDGRGPKDFFGADILARRDFLGSMKDARIFLGRENNTGIFWGIVFFISSNQK